MAIEIRPFDCNCCGMSYEIELHHYEPTPFQCDVCRPHRDAATATELVRQHDDHKLLWQANLDDMQKRIEDAERRTQSVYHTRGLALGVLNRINAAHYLRPNGACSCNVKTCKVGTIIDGERALSNAIRSFDAREQKRLARIRREESMDEYYDEWDRYVDRNIIEPSPERDERTGTA